MICSLRLFLLALGLVLCVAPPAAAGSSARAASAVVGSFVTEVDHAVGYAMLRPAAWAGRNADMAGRAYFDHANANQARFQLVVNNLAVLAQRYGAPNTIFPDWEAFRATPTLAGWSTALERRWRHDAQPFRLVNALPNAKIYTSSLPDRSRSSLVAYVVDDGQPLVVALAGSGAQPRLPGLAQLRARGLFADFTRMVRSIQAIAPEIGPERRGPVTIQSGPFYSDTGYRDTGTYRWRLYDVYYQSPPRVYELYEYVNSYQAWNDFRWNPYLFRTNVGDGDPVRLCQQGGGLYEHPIAKTGANGVVSDAFWPNKYVAHLNTTTWHTMYWHYGETVNVCNRYQPYRQI